MDMLLPSTPDAALHSGKISHFLADNAQRALLWIEDGDSAKREKFEAQNAHFWNLLGACGKQAEPAEAFLFEAAMRSRGSQADVVAGIKVKGGKPTQNVAFAVEGKWLHEAAIVPKFWKERRAGEDGAGEAGIDITDGVPTASVLSSHGPIKGIRAGQPQPSGVRLISNDKSAFQSFGLEDARNAPVSSANEAKYRAALNELVRTGQALPGANLCFWTRSGTDFNPWDIAGNASPEAVRALFAAPATGRAADAGLDSDGFFALALSGVGGRLMVRGWLDTTVGAAKGNLRLWFEDLAIVASDGGAVIREHKLFALLYALARPDELDSLPPQLASDLWDCALNGVRPPSYILRLLVRRETLDRFAGGDVKDVAGRSMRRMALARLCLRRATLKEVSDMSASLDAEVKDPAYVCGRIMAVLDRLQYLASGGVGAGIVERAYGAASATPGVVFGRLMRLAQTHLSKLRKSMPGAAVNVEKELEQLTSCLGVRWPRSLSLDEQACFALGFYHQKAEHRRRSEQSNSEHKEDA